jgi:hypothetical protein
MNPFAFYSSPASAKEAQSNANYATYERMGADAALREFDIAGTQAPQKVIGDASTWRWVEREHIRVAQKMRASESTSTLS